MTMYLQGRYRPLNPKKYRGDINKIVFRSSLELVAFKFCDMNPAIIWWSSEETIVRYVSPVDNRVHRYFVDLQVWTKNKDTGEQQVTLIEIKPRDQIKEPKRGTKKEKTFVNEMMTWKVNEAKWAAARAVCASKENWSFLIWTEDHLVPGQDPEVRARFRMKSQARREKDAEEKKRATSVAMIKERLKKEAAERAASSEKKDPDSLLP
ncbi:head completion protein [Erwinia phage vB_EamM-Bue1]|uniref:Head completion nuclease n=1 Tax=Erwinia phage vB_EamM-Bue1 TaxID=2099338 RepID=A0A2P1JU38_9CAUD|nr:head completion protein [Erwinia phage vB_EamM-Bue1]AVO22866.1 head completion protein [Erwinia phage vB_EamM-Bue1]